MRIKISLGLVSGILLLWLAGPAAAITVGYYFQTPPGATLGGQPVSASATVKLNPDTDQISVHLYNNQANPTSVIQNLSDFGFTLSTGQSVGSLGSSLASAGSIAVNGDKSFSYANGTTTGWELQSNYNFIPLENGIIIGTLGTGLRLYVLGTPVGPANTIIGFPEGDTYSNANGSIAGNNAHNPFILYEAWFYLTVPGIDEFTAVTGAIFSFGTEDTSTAVPEPWTFILLGAGVSVVAGSARKFARA